MTVFKTVLKIIKKNITPIIMYTVCLIIFGGLNIKTSDNSMNFVSEKPDILIVNNDKNEGITKDLIKYLEERTNIKDIENNEEKIDDAVFYRDLNYVVYIPENFRQDFLDNKNPKVEIKSTGDYQASLADMLVNKYLNTLNKYRTVYDDEDEIIKLTKDTLDQETDISVTTKLDTNKLAKATFFFNFTNYPLLAGCVYVICLILSSFQEEKIKKRTIISSTNYKTYNRKLMLSMSLFAFIFAVFYILLAIVLNGKIMSTIHGLLYAINMFAFTACALSIAFLIGNIITNKEAINGIINVVALGTSFLCGSFVPVEWLPDSVLKIAHALPSYYFINSNELIKKLEVINLENLKPLITNTVIILAFTIIFIIITLFISKKKRKFN